MFSYICQTLEIVNQVIPSPSPHITLALKREDLIHPFVSGNKFRKLKYNLEAAKEGNHKTILTFGGAFSNHIAAVAAAGKAKGFETIGVIRGEELAATIEQNPTLKFARECGMRVDFISRENYRHKTQTDFLQGLKTQYGDFYLIPEGGTNELAVKGCEEILTQNDYAFDYICCAVGTGGTIAGLIISAAAHQKVLGFPALKGDFLNKEICNFAPKGAWELINDYHFGGYAKVTPELIGFLNEFYKQTKIPLDPIYTGKMVFGVIDLIRRNYFPVNAKILMVHTGGIQGIAGMNLKLKNRQSPLIDYHD